MRTPSWAVGGETSIGDDGRTTSRQPLRSVESVPCRVDGGDRHGSSSASALRVSRRSISRDSRDIAFERAVSFTAAAVAAAAEAASSTSSSNFSPATVQECGYYPVGMAAMAHNRGFSSVDEPISCVDVVDLSEEFLMSTGEVKTHTRSRSSVDEHFTAVSEVRCLKFLGGRGYLPVGKIGIFSPRLAEFREQFQKPMLDRG